MKRLNETLRLKKELILSLMLSANDDLTQLNWRMTGLWPDSRFNQQPAPLTI